MPTYTVRHLIQGHIYSNKAAPPNDNIPYSQAKKHRNQWWTYSNHHNCPPSRSSDKSLFRKCNLLNCDYAHTTGSKVLVFGSDVICCGEVREVIALDPAHFVLMVFCGSVTPALSRRTLRLFHVLFLFSEPQFNMLRLCAPPSPPIILGLREVNLSFSLLKAKHGNFKNICCLEFCSISIFLS